MKKIFLILFVVLNASIVFSQRVDINTTTPLQTLDVRGSVYFSDNQGIGVSNPLARLHVADSSVVLPLQDKHYSRREMFCERIGRRMLWYADKAASEKPTNSHQLG